MLNLIVYGIVLILCVRFIYHLSKIPFITPDVLIGWAKEQAERGENSTMRETGRRVIEFINRKPGEERIAAISLCATMWVFGIISSIVLLIVGNRMIDLIME